MALKQKAVNGLYKGVTKQEATNRIEGQVEESINNIHSVERGISRRNPTELVKSIPYLEGDHFMHSYARGDGSEEYIILIKSGSIHVYDTQGNPYTVWDTGDTLDYLKAEDVVDIANNYKALTVGDTTFILNKSRTCAMSPNYDGTEDDHKKNPFYWVKRSFDNGQNLGYDYTLDGKTVNATKSSSACAQLASQLGTDYVSYGSIVVRTSSPSSGTFVWSDSFGSQASEGFWGVAQKISDLPSTMSGAEKDYDFIIKVQGDPDNQYTSFWVKYEDGHWKETVKPHLQNDINKLTMPLKLVRGISGEFTLETIDYESRKFGDENTASVPSFIGRRISDIFFFKNRLCFSADENVIMSQTGEYYNFFPTTVTDVIDSDPIDVAVDSNSVSMLNHSVPFNDSVILLSSNGQFSLQADKVLSPNDVSISSTTSYDALKNVKPVPLGNSLFFLSSTLQGVSLREFFVDPNGGSNTAIDVSGHVKGYIPNNIINMVGNTNQDILFILSGDDQGSLYVYKFYNDGQERIQTAWSKWTFDGVIRNITILDNYLYLIMQRSFQSQTFIERLDYSSAPSTTPYLDNGTIPYQSKTTLSEMVLKDAEGRLIQSARSPLMYKTLQIESTVDSDYGIEIVNKLRTRVATGHAVKDSKVLLAGKSNQVTLSIQSIDGKPLEFHTYTMEMNYNIRAEII